MRKKNRNIGILISSLYDDYEQKLWSGIINAARETNTKTFSYHGGTLGLDKGRNYIFNLINTTKIDGLISFTSSIGNHIGITKTKKFLAKFSRIPIISIGCEITGTTSIQIDNRSGMHNLVEHFINVHNCSRIAFIRGPQNSREAETRYLAYTDVLKNYSIPFDKKLIIQADFIMGRELPELIKFLDTKNLKYDAIIACNDYLAVQAIKELNKRKINVPDDIPVAGFDDLDDTSEILLPLTTVHQSPYDMGYHAFQSLLSILNGEKITTHLTLPTKLIIRRSCGCFNHFTDSSIEKNNIKESNKNSGRPLFQQSNIISEILYEINKKDNNLENFTDRNKLIRKLLKSYLKCKKDNSSNHFILILEKSIIQNIDKIDIITWHNIISAFFKITEQKIKNRTESKLNNKLFKNSILLIENYFKNLIINIKIRNKISNMLLFYISEAFISAAAREDIKETIIEKFPQLDINSCYIYLYSRKKKFSRHFVSYNIQMNKKDKKDGIQIKSNEVIPDNIILNNNQQSFLIMPLYFKTKNIGLAIFEVKNAITHIYETLSIQLSSALQNTGLLERIRRDNISLEKKVHERTIKLEQANKEIAKRNKNLQKIDTLKTDFIANITHDFRSPLTVIMNMAELGILQKNTTKKQHEENYQHIYNASIKLKETTDRLLEIAKMDARGIKLRIQKVEIIPFLTTIKNFYDSALRNNNIKIILNDVPDKNTFIYTDSIRLEEVLHNLISNSIKFIDKEPGIIKINVTEEKDSIIICVSDNGIGIPEEKLDSIFNRFEQIDVGHKSKYEGTGIGLAYSKKLINFLKGKIWAESKNIGAQLYIELKKGENIFNKKDVNIEFIQNHDLDKQYITGSRMKSLNEKIELELSKKKLHNHKIYTSFTQANLENEYDHKKSIILIVDDDEQIQFIVKKYLENHGYKNFILTDNGIQGLEAIYKYRPHLIISDYNMPDFSGDVFYEKISANPNLRNIPFIFLSAIADEKRLMKRKRKGACAYLSKPIDEKKFIITVEFHLKKYLTYVEAIQNSYIDQLTGLNNHNYLIKALKHELSMHNLRDLSLLLIDINNLASYNHTYNHKLGDEILKLTGKTILKKIREYDIAGLYQEDDFIIILPETDIKNTQTIILKIQKSIEQINLECAGKKIIFSVNFGTSSLFNSEAQICRQLEIAKLTDLYSRQNKNIKKEKIAEILIKLAYQDLKNNSGQK